MPWRLAGAAVQAGTSIWGQIQSNKNIDKQLAAQARENKYARKYNLKLAQLQNKWNRQQWQMENAYNSPFAQIRRMREAGLNPDMMYGGGVSGNLSASSPSMSSGSPYSPMDYTALGSKVPVGVDAVSSFLDTQLKQAQIDNINADTEKKGAETSILSSDAAFRDALNQGQLDLTRMQIRGINSDMQVNNSQMMKMRAETRKLNQETENLIKTYDLIKSQIVNMDADTAYKQLRGVLDSKETDALVNKFAADTNLSRAECRAIVSRLPFELLGLQADAAYTQKQTDLVKLDNDVVSWQFDQDKTYEDWKRSIGIAGDVVNALEGLASIIGTAFGGGKPTRVRGFGR